MFTTTIISKLRQYRFLGVAVADVLATILGGVIVAIIFKKSIWNVTVCLFLVGILVHRVLCKRTAVDKLLFYDDCAKN